jgi:hypothetical protein
LPVKTVAVSGNYITAKQGEVDLIRQKHIIYQILT